MKRILSLFLTAFSLSLMPAGNGLLAQTTIGISQHPFFRIPDTIALGQFASYKVWVRNYGPSDFSGDIEVVTAIYDTSLRVIGRDSSLFGTSGFLPGDSALVNINEFYDAQNYSIGKNVVVIWPVINQPYVDVADTIVDTVIVLPPDFITSLPYGEIRENHTAYPNPAGQEVLLPYDNMLHVTVYDASGRKAVRIVPENRSVRVADFERGIYIMEVLLENNERKRIRIVKQ